MELPRCLRLALIHPVAAERTAWASRLHRTTVVEFENVQDFESRASKCDLVVLSSSHHPKNLLDLLAARLHVLLIAGQVPDEVILESLYSAAGVAGVQLTVMNPDRYLPSRQQIRRQVGNTLGEPGLIRSHRWLPSTNEGEFSEWLVRDLDSILWLAGRYPDRVFALESKQDGSPGRYLQVHLGFPGGGMALLDLTNRLPAGDGYASLSVIASSGAAYADDHHNMQLLYRGDRPQALQTDERARQHAAMIQETIDAILLNRDCSATLAEWRNAWAVANAVGHSIASGQAVTIGGE